MDAFILTSNIASIHKHAQALTTNSYLYTRYTLPSIHKLPFYQSSTTFRTDAKALITPWAICPKVISSSESWLTRMSSAVDNMMVRRSLADKLGSSTFLFYNLTHFGSKSNSRPKLNGVWTSEATINYVPRLLAFFFRHADDIPYTLYIYDFISRIIISAYTYNNGYR